MNRATKLLVIAGPTAGGKSALGLEFAERLNGEIISGDSMQLYRGLSIGVAKPDAAEQRRVKHHLIDVFDFSVPVDVYRYLELAEPAIDEVSLHGALPVVVGGTGMYLKALLYGLDELPGDAVVRKELDRSYDNESGEAELKRLHDIFVKNFSAEDLMEGLGREFYTTTTFKPWPACRASSSSW